MSSFESKTSLEPISSGLTAVCELASGGMGKVELAMRKQGDFRRLYAVKRLHPQFHTDEDLRAMFLQEARLAGLIQHPNVVSVLDVGEDENGPYLVLEYVDGLSLAKLLSLAAQDEQLLPVQTCLRIALQIALGLQAAHELSDREGRSLELVHRDLSPQNVLIDWHGTVRLTDFGIAKAIGQSTKTATGVVKGKLSYLSPEQLRYETIDQRTDLFALGIVLFEIFAGRRLYKNREGNDGLRRIMHEPPPDIGEERPEVPPRVVELLFQLLAKEREQRPRSAREVVEALQLALSEVLAEEPVLEVGPVVGELAGELRANQERRIAAAIEEAEARAEAMSSGAVAVGNARALRRYVVAAVVAIGLVGAGFGAATLTRSASVAPPPPLAAPGTERGEPGEVRVSGDAQAGASTVVAPAAAELAENTGDGPEPTETGATAADSTAADPTAADSTAAELDQDAEEAAPAVEGESGESILGAEETMAAPRRSTRRRRRPRRPAAMTSMSSAMQRRELLFD